MAASRTVLAEYFTSPDGVVLFLADVRSAAPDAIRLSVPVERLRQFAAKHFASAERVRSLAEPDLGAWQEQFGPLVAPIARFANPGDVVWLVPHDVLHRLPLHALHIDGVPLIERNPVCYSPSASVMKYCRMKRKGQRATALVVGDPLGDLTHARAEAGAVAAMFGVEPLVGADAGRDRVRAALDDPDRRHDVIHFACHGRLDRTDAWRSGLELADGRLTAAEILALRYRAELVTLSACESGLNEHRPGDELLGLTRALIHAGSPSVLVSLWAVHDLSTRLLMERFYEEFRSPGVTKAEALRMAQLTVRDLGPAGIAAARSREITTAPEADSRRAETFSHLYYWAPFVLVGDWA